MSVRERLIPHGLSELLTWRIEELEALYRDSPLLALPQRGTYRGVYLKRLNNPGANGRSYRWFQWAMFDLTPFGLNFHDGWGDWYFFHPALAVGKFVPRSERSRWRDTPTHTLNYESSRLPAPARRVLYDELKPLSDELMLGLGGVNAGRDQGDHFFFALQRTAWT